MCGLVATLPLFSPFSPFFNWCCCFPIPKELRNNFLSFSLASPPFFCQSGFGHLSIPFSFVLSLACEFEPGNVSRPWGSCNIDSFSHTVVNPRTVSTTCQKKSLLLLPLRFTLSCVTRTSFGECTSNMICRIPSSWCLFFLSLRHLWLARLISFFGLTPCRTCWRKNMGRSCLWSMRKLTAQWSSLTRRLHIRECSKWFEIFGENNTSS